MRTETTAHFILAAKNTFTEALVFWRNRAVNVGNRTRCEFLQVKLSLDRPGLGSTLESTQARSRRDKFAIAFAACRMPHALTGLLPEDHRSVEKQSCKRQDNNGRPKYQNVCIAFWSAAFVFDSVLAIERTVYWRSGWVVLSCLGGPFIVGSIVRRSIWWLASSVEALFSGDFATVHSSDLGQRGVYIWENLKYLIKPQSLEDRAHGLVQASQEKPATKAFNLLHG